MNWKQKLLTILALILFVTIGWLHLAEIGFRPTSYTGQTYRGQDVVADPGYPGYMPHSITPWFMLGVTYAALFFLLASRRTQ